MENDIVNKVAKFRIQQENNFKKSHTTLLTDIIEIISSHLM